MLSGPCTPFPSHALSSRLTFFFPETSYLRPSFSSPCPSPTSSACPCSNRLSPTSLISSGRLSRGTAAGTRNCLLQDGRFRSSALLQTAHSGDSNGPLVLQMEQRRALLQAWRLRCCKTKPLLDGACTAAATTGSTMLQGQLCRGRCGNPLLQHPSLRQGVVTAASIAATVDQSYKVEPAHQSCNRRTSLVLQPASDVQGDARSLELQPEDLVGAATTKFVGCG